MTNRNYVRPFSAGMAIKKPRLRRVEIGAERPPPTPEGISNGFRPHGGYRGMKQHPPGQFSFDKEESYASEVQEEYQVLINQENQENHGAPYWVPDVQREITHSGESPLFTNKLLASGKFEQEHGVINMERALFSVQPRHLMSAPRRRHLNGMKEFYRPNSTHQYLSATDLRNIDDNEEVMTKYGRPTRTTLLRARQRSNSAINSYDVRRQATKRMEEVKNNTIFYTAKESFEREQSRLSYRYINIYQSDGQTVHSFLTGARYNRAHLLDSKGLSVYGVYMPRENPGECFITPQRRLKDVGDDIPSAPPDSPRSDLDESPMPHHSRPTSSIRHNMMSRESSRSGSSRPTSKTTSSRPPSNRRGTPQTLGSRPRSAKDPISGSSGLSLNIRPHPPRSADSSRRELPLPDEVTMAMPDHVNKGKAGVYVTLKGQKLIESVESKLPRVTGVSLPKLRNKSRDFMDEVQVVNQPPPTPVEPSVVSVEKNRFENDNTENSNRLTVHDRAMELTTEKDDTTMEKEDKNINQTFVDGDNQGNSDGIVKDETNDKNEVLGEVVVNENAMDDRKTLEIRPAKHVNFIGVHEDKVVESDTGITVKEDTDEVSLAKGTVEQEENEKPNIEQESVKPVKDDNVVFFMTEDDGPKEGKSEIDNEANKDEKTHVKDEGEDTVEDAENDKNIDNGEIEEADKSVDDVIKVEISEISENDKSREKTESEGDDPKRLSSNDYPFTQSSEQ